MRLLRRALAWLGLAALFGVAILLILESTGLLGTTWRAWVATGARWLGQPSIPAWLAALLGALLAIVALTILVLQFARAPMTHAVVLVQRSVAGATLVSPTVVRRAAVQRLTEIEGIIEAAPFAHGERLELRLRLERGANAPRIEEHARAALGDGFWAMLGVPPQPLDLRLTYATTLDPSLTVN